MNIVNKKLLWPIVHKWYEKAYPEKALKINLNKEAIMKYLFLFLFITTAMFSVFQQGVIDGLRLENARLKATAEKQDTRTKVLTVYLQKRFRLNKLEASRFADYYMAAGKEFNVDPYLLVSMSSAESAFRRDAISDKDAIGIMQVVPRYWLYRLDFIHTRADLFNPQLNIRAGAYILAYFMKKCGGLRQGIRCYNGGPRAVKNPRLETINYEYIVMRRYNNI